MSLPGAVSSVQAKERLRVRRFLISTAAMMPSVIMAAAVGQQAQAATLDLHLSVTDETGAKYYKAVDAFSWQVDRVEGRAVVEFEDGSVETYPHTDFHIHNNELYLSASNLGIALPYEHAETRAFAYAGSAQAPIPVQTTVDYVSGSGGAFFNPMFLILGVGGLSAAALAAALIADRDDDDDAVLNNAPVADVDGIYVTAGNGSLTSGLDVLLNDTDADEGDTLVPVSLSSAQGTYGSFQLSADGKDIEYAFADNAAAAALGAGETARDTATYKVSDGKSTSEAVTLTAVITGVNDAPVDGDESFSVAATEGSGDTEATNVLTGTSDPDGDDLVVSAVGGNASGVGTFVAGSNGGLFQINADGSLDFDANGAFDGLGAGETATTSITYEVSDGQGGTDTSTLTVTINGANAAPTDGDETGAVGAGDGVTSLTNALINVSDPDLTDTHTVSAVSGGMVGGSVAGTNGGFFAIASDGTATFDPNGAFNSLADAATETTAVTYTVSDGNGGTDTSTMTVTVTGANDAPTVSTAPSDQTVQDKANIALDLSATFADIDTGDSMTYSATGLPTGLTISSTGVVSGTIDISDPLTAISPTVTLTGTDGGGATASTSFTYNVGLNVEDSEVPSSSDYTITGGAGPDTVVDGINSASGAGNTGVINLGNGANTLTIGTSAALGGTLSYTGGTGVDTISIGDDAATGSGVMNLNLGDDSVTDVITFQGSVSHPSSGGGVTITNFDAAEDFLILAGMSMTSNVSITSTGSGVNIASTGSAPVFVDVDVVGSTTVSDYNLSINGSGDLLIS